VYIDSCSWFSSQAGHAIDFQTSSIHLDMEPLLLEILMLVLVQRLSLMTRGSCRLVAEICLDRSVQQFHQFQGI
jgi:hypothetical protein